MKLKDILRDISVIKSTADMDMEISSVAIDSRRAAPGSLFVAMTGFETDGHLYIPSAAENGAAAVVCEKAPEGGVPYVMVENSRAALAILAVRSAPGADWVPPPRCAVSGPTPYRGARAGMRRRSECV